MKKVKWLVADSLRLWLLIATTLVVLMYATEGNLYRELLCSLMIATFFVLPFRDKGYKLIKEALEHFAYQSANTKNWLLKNSTKTDITKEKDSLTEWPLFYSTLKAIVTLISIILALLALFFKGTSSMLIYSKLRPLELLLTGQIPVGNLILCILFEIVWVALTISVIRKILLGVAFFNASGNFDTRLTIINLSILIVAFILHTVGAGACLKQPAFLIGTQILFWITIVVALTVAIPLMALAIKFLFPPKKK